MKHMATAVDIPRRTSAHNFGSRIPDRSLAASAGTDPDNGHHVAKTARHNHVNAIARTLLVVNGTTSHVQHKPDSMRKSGAGATTGKRKESKSNNATGDVGDCVFSVHTPARMDSGTALSLSAALDTKMGCTCHIRSAHRPDRRTRLASNSCTETAASSTRRCPITPSSFSSRRLV